MRFKKGFTLIELVVVMAIIAVLALLIVAAITAARRQSENTRRSGNLKTIETALEARFSKCGTYFAVKTGVTGCAAITTTNIGTIADSLKNEDYLSQEVNGISGQGAATGYNLISPVTEQFEIRACPVTALTADTEKDCTATDALYIAKR